MNTIQDKKKEASRHHKQIREESSRNQQQQTEGGQIHKDRESFAAVYLRERDEGGGGGGNDRRRAGVITFFREENGDVRFYLRGDAGRVAIRDGDRVSYMNTLLLRRARHDLAVGDLRYFGESMSGKKNRAGLLEASALSRENHL